MSTTTEVNATPAVTAAMVDAYRTRGFVHVPGVISATEAARFAEAAARFRAARADMNVGAGYSTPVFDQLINVWREDETMRELTLNPQLHAAAEQLAGIPLNVWHDHMLIKAPHNQAPTEFHQDLPYWPHATSRHSLSAWVALVDVPVERGCMTFIPGSHEIKGLRPQDLTSPRDLFEIAPELTWKERVTIPLKAGDCTFHNSSTAHMATPNNTDEDRFAHVVIYMDTETTFNGKQHVITEPLALQPGAPLTGELFPRPAH